MNAPMVYAVFGVPKGKSSVEKIEGGFPDYDLACRYMDRHVKFGGLTNAFVSGVENPPRTLEAVT